MECIILQLITNIQRNENEAGQADRESTNVDNGIFQVPADIPKGDEDVEFEHGQKILVVVMAAIIFVLDFSFRVVEGAPWTLFVKVEMDDSKI